MFREVRADTFFPHLVPRPSLLFLPEEKEREPGNEVDFFHKARALRHTSALSRYNAHSLRHQYERAQFTIHFIKEIKNFFLVHR